MAVLLASLPFGPLRSPSLGLSLLQGALAREGIEARIRYFNLAFARSIGVDAWRTITGHRFTPDLAGEWVFAEALQGRALDAEAYRTRILGGGDPAHAKAPGFQAEPELHAALARARAVAPAFLEGCAEAILAEAPRVVGLTSVFEQNAASLALARLLKARRPDLLLVLGGANAEGPMGEALFEAYPFLDVVCSGAAEARFPALVKAFLGSGRVPEMPGLLVRSPVAGPRWELEEPVGLDALPVPAFDDYFEQVEGLGIDVELPFEASRGCWWGAKQHCTFCGLNGGGMAFRAKHPDRAHAELAALVTRHPGHRVFLVDNILDMTYFQTLLPRLAAEGPAVDLFVEVKANLTKPQLRLMKAAGLRRLQPGIESLADGVLKLMRKGVRALHNVQLLKWCGELGLDPVWNLLGGFPGEDPEDYARMAAWIPWLTHLKPPMACGHIRLDRFSPNYEGAASLGLRDVRAYPAYAHVYGLAPERLDGLAYHFAHADPEGVNVQAHLGPLQAVVAGWQAAWGRESLLWIDQGHQGLAFDQRRAASASVHLLDGPEAWLLRAGDGVVDPAKLRPAFAAAHPGEDLTARLGSLEARGLILQTSGAFLALPLPATPEVAP